MNSLTRVKCEMEKATTLFGTRQGAYEIKQIFGFRSSWAGRFSWPHPQSVVEEQVISDVLALTPGYVRVCLNDFYTFLNV